MLVTISDPSKEVATGGRLDCEIFADYDALAPAREEWDSTVLRLGGPVYLSYDWSRIWWQYYGRNRELKLFLFRANEQLVGIVPLYIDSLGIPPFRLRVARIVGANLPPKTFDPPIAPEFASQIWSRVLENLFGETRCDLLSFGPVSGSYVAAASLADASTYNKSIVSSLVTVQRDVRTLYSLPSSFELYFNSLDSRERKVRRKKLRDLEAAGPVHADLISSEGAVEKEFDAFADAHTQQWQAEGRPGHFHAWPRGLEYNKALVKCLGKLGRVRFYRLLQGDKVITSQYTYGFGKTLYAELPARMFGPEWDKLSLGGTSQIKLIEAAIQDGFQCMDSGLGHYEYKILTGGVEQPVNTLYVTRGKAQSRVRVEMWRRFGALQRLILNKIWYRKVSPWLPVRFRGPQSSSQIRFDF